MAVSKKTTGGKRKSTNTRRKNTKNNSRSTARKNNTSKSNNNRNNYKAIQEYQDYQAFETGVTMFVLGIISIVLYLCFFGLASVAGKVTGGIVFGIFGWFAWFLPICIFVGYVFSIVNHGDKRVIRRIASFMGMILNMLGLTDLIFQNKIITEYFAKNHIVHKDFFKCIYLSCNDVMGNGKFSGGIIGRVVGIVFSGIVGKVAAIIILLALLFLCAYIFYGVELMGVVRKRNARTLEMEEIKGKMIEEDGYEEPSYRILKPSVKREKKKVEKPVLQKAPKVRTFTLEPEDEEVIEQKTEKPLKQDEKKEKEERDVFKAEEIVVPVGEEIDLFQALEEDIPIYRNELQEKFGQKKPKNTKLDKEPIKEPVKEKTQNSTAVEKKDEVKKPLASFAHKEEVIDVTPNCQKEKNKTEIKEENDNKKEVEEKPVIDSTDKTDLEDNQALNQVVDKPYEFPPLDLLSIPKQHKSAISDGQLRITATKLQDTLKSFNVNVKIGAVTCGPTVTRYEILPEQGVRVNKITNLADDIKLSLAAQSIRIEAPIPGKAAVGIEVPNPTASPVYFRELLEGDTFSKAKSPLTFAVGKDITGNLIMTDIGKTPHMLIAGATGSGKSVCINTLIMSILYKANPDEVKLIMIDPKVVELSVYNGIPHLFCPVVTDPKEAAAALNWAVREMGDRYETFKEFGVRGIAGYNEKIAKSPEAEAKGYKKMPYLVIIVDEFADLMMVASKEVEDAVCRLAQLARAAGIHLVLATQRPSVNVITGIIKANIPSRVAFSVSSSVDSRTILDRGGAEKLLGKGDMLFYPYGYTDPVRVQGAFISDNEVSDVVEFLRSNNETPEYNDKVTEIVEEEKTEEQQPEKRQQPDRDEYFYEAGKFVIESERAAAGQLQRHFSIGFNRAGRIIDQLHKAGVVGPAEGTKPRKVLMTLDEFERTINGDSDGDSSEIVDEVNDIEE